MRAPFFDGPALRLTVPHYFDFGQARELIGAELSDPGSWDNLRLQTEGPFEMASTRTAWEAHAHAQGELGDRAARVAAEARTAGAQSMTSYGVGSGMLEYHLRQLEPGLELTLTEFAPETVDRLTRYLPEVVVRNHNLLRDPPITADIHLFHRIDTEFSNAEWKQLLASFREETVIVVATQLLDWRQVVRELRQRRNPNATRAGVFRTASAFEALWRPTHQATRRSFASLEGWVLEPRER